MFPRFLFLGDKGLLDWRPGPIRCIVANISRDLRLRTMYHRNLCRSRTVLDPRNASIVFTPLDLRNRLHPTIGRLLIVETGDVARCLDPDLGIATHDVFARPVQTNTFTEVMPILSNDDDDPNRAMLSAFARLILLDGFDAGTVGAIFAAHLAGWREILSDARPRHFQRMTMR